MSSPAPFDALAALLEKSLSIRHVYGEPVQQGDRTVIPVAKVAFGFGAGGGEGGRRSRKPADQETAAGPEGQGAGGGGGVRMMPVGVIEVGPEGTRFVALRRPVAPLIASAVLGVALGWLLTRRSHA
jgi:uncharacterized spore protein YtfJ